jgi:hypothetical protein
MANGRRIELEACQRSAILNEEYLKKKLENSNKQIEKINERL